MTSKNERENYLRMRDSKLCDAILDLSIEISRVSWDLNIANRIMDSFLDLAKKAMTNQRMYEYTFKRVKQDLSSAKKLRESRNELLRFHKSIEPSFLDFYEKGIKSD